MFANKRISLLRVIGLIAIAAVLYLAIIAGWNWFRDVRTPIKEPWFAGYVDVTATPNYQFENAKGESSQNMVLAFIVNDPEEDCKPSWGGYFSLDEASYELDLDRKIARANSSGRHAILSFGGERGQNIAERCASADDLRKAYAAVLERYDINTVDFDIEGDALADTDANQRRAEAVAKLQTQYRERGDQLAVWVTLPVNKQGLTQQGIDVVETMLSYGVDLSGVNLMTMNFNTLNEAFQLSDLLDISNLLKPSGDYSKLMQHIMASIISAQSQVQDVFNRHGHNLSSKDAWQKIGVTPMIGQNDIEGEVFTLDDARDLNDFLRERHVRRISFWSLNRDATCSSNYPTPNEVSVSCSGIDQKDWKFADLLSINVSGVPNALQAEESDNDSTDTDPGNLGNSDGANPGIGQIGGERPIVVDDPATSPYPIWQETSRYPAGTKVTWRKNVYQAKWWTEGSQPDLPVAVEADSPWQLIGPVLPGEKPRQIPLLPDGLYPKWNDQVPYTRGERVMSGDFAYEALWYTVGENPELSLADPGNSSWRQLSEAEVIRILNALKNAESENG